MNCPHASGREAGWRTHQPGVPANGCPSHETQVCRWSCLGLFLTMARRKGEPLSGDLHIKLSVVCEQC